MSSAFWTRLHVQLSGCVWFGPSEKREFSVLTVHPWDALYRLYSIVLSICILPPCDSNNFWVKGLYFYYSFLFMEQ